MLTLSRCAHVTALYALSVDAFSKAVDLDPRNADVYGPNPPRNGRTPRRAASQRGTARPARLRRPVVSVGPVPAHSAAPTSGHTPELRPTRRTEPAGRPARFAAGT